MRASELDWGKVRYFSPEEFPGDALKRVDAELILSLNEFRHRLRQRVKPSPVLEGWYREDGSVTSRHYAVGRDSTAGDVFPDGCILNAWLAALGMSEFGGIGIYLDTKLNGEPHPMLHMDLRKKRTIWMRYKGEYIYPAKSPADKARFFKLLSEAVDAND